MPRLLEEVRGQRNPTEEAQASERARRQREERERKERERAWAEMVKTAIPHKE